MIIQTWSSTLYNRGFRCKGSRTSIFTSGAGVVGISVVATDVVGAWVVGVAVVTTGAAVVGHGVVVWVGHALPEIKKQQHKSETMIIITPLNKWYYAVV